MPAKRTSKGNLFQRGKQGRWYCQHYADRKQVITRLLNAEGKPCASRKEAEAARDMLLAPLAMKDKAAQLRTVAATLASVEDKAAALVEAARPRLAVADAWEAYLADPRRLQSGPLTLADYGQRWGKFSTWAKGAGVVNMEGVGEEHAGAFLATLADLSPNRRNKIHETCKLVFKTLAHKCNDMPNPFAELSKKPLATVNRRALSVQELKAVCMAAEGELRVLLAMATYTGLRLHDAVTLAWSNIDLARGLLTCKPHKTRRVNKSVVIPLADPLRAILEEMPADRRTGPIMPDLLATYNRDRSKITKLVKDHFENCGVLNATLHCLRHSFISISAAAGVPLSTLQAIAGHSGAAQQHYLHAGEVETRAAVASLPNVTVEAVAKPDPLAALRRSIVEAVATASEKQLGAVAKALGIGKK